MDKDLKTQNRIKNVAMFLKKLYDATKKPLANPKIIEEIGNQVGIGSLGSVRALLVKHKYVAVSKNTAGNKMITWIGPEPNINIAEVFSNQLKNLFKKYAGEDVEEKDEVEVVSLKIKGFGFESQKQITKTEALIEKGNRSEREFKIHMLMQFLYEKVRDLMLSDVSLELSTRLKQYSLEPEIIDVLVANNKMDRERHKDESLLVWISDEPTEQMVNDIYKQFEIYQKIKNVKNKYDVPVKDKTTNMDELKVINVLKTNGRSFSDIAKLVERPETDVRKMFYEFLIKLNS